MIRSMTGFATHSITLTRDSIKSQISMTIKSLNSRYFEVTYKTAYPLTPLETEITKILKERLLRGHVFVSLHMSNQQLFKGSIEPNLSTIEEYISAIKKINDTFHLDGSLSAETLLELPNVFISEEQSIDEQSKKAFFDALQLVIDQVINSQELEGQSLLKDVHQRIQIINAAILAVEKASTHAVEAQKIKIQEALKELTTDETKLVDFQKNALFATLDKIDIHEEIIRFKNHLQNLQAQLNSQEAEKGKRLDFILQELGREINTIAAKCSDSVISAHAIDIKVELEKVREQIQNIV